jgi:hypothetical protein
MDRADALRAALKTLETEEPGETEIEVHTNLDLSSDQENRLRGLLEGIL